MDDVQLEKNGEVVDRECRIRGGKDYLRDCFSRCGSEIREALRLLDYN
jgi:hypothetical protein